MPTHLKYPNLRRGALCFADGKLAFLRIRSETLKHGGPTYTTDGYPRFAGRAEVVIEATVHPIDLDALEPQIGPVRLAALKSILDQINIDHVDLSEI